MKTCPTCSHVLIPIEVLHEEPNGSGLATYRCRNCDKVWRMHMEVPLEKLFLIAGNRGEYTEFLMKNSLTTKDVTYLTEPRQIEGVHHFVVLRYGTWITRKDIHKLLEWAEAHLKKQEDL